LQLAALMQMDKALDYAHGLQISVVRLIWLHACL